MKWVVAFNLHTREWSEGGRVSEYPQEHWDLYAVEARGRDEARQKAAALRRAHTTLSKAQEVLLASMVAEFRAYPAEGSASIHADEARAAAALASKGLLVQKGPMDYTLGISAANRNVRARR